MHDWYSLNLGDAMLATEPLACVERLFRAEFERAGCPADMALYLRHESEGRLHCDLVVYLSPAAAGIAAQVGAEPCDPPTPDGLSRMAAAMKHDHDETGPA